MTDDQIKLNEFRDKEIQNRLTRLADGWGGYNLNYDSAFCWPRLSAA